MKRIWTEAGPTGRLICIDGDDVLRKGKYEPGNGTSYTAIAVRCQPGSCGGLGSVEDGWLVVSGLTCKAYLFQKEGYLLDEYIRKHLGGLEGDYPHFGDLLRMMLKRPGGRVPSTEGK